MHHLEIAETMFRYKSLSDLTTQLQHQLERLSTKTAELETEIKRVHSQEKAIRRYLKGWSLDGIEERTAPRALKTGGDRVESNV